MPDINLRQYLVEQLTPLLPKTWRLLPNTPNLDTIDRVTVTVRIDKIERLKEAPQSHRKYFAVVRVIDPSTDIDRVDDALDDDIIDLLNAIDELENVAWITAERGVIDGSSNFAFDITVEVPYRKEKTNG